MIATFILSRISGRDETDVMKGVVREDRGEDEGGSGRGVFDPLPAPLLFLLRKVFYARNRRWRVNEDVPSR